MGYPLTLRFQYSYEYIVKIYDSVNDSGHIVKNLYKILSNFKVEGNTNYFWDGNLK